MVFLQSAQAMYVFYMIPKRFGYFDPVRNPDHNLDEPLNGSSYQASMLPRLSLSPNSITNVPNSPKNDLRSAVSGKMKQVPASQMSPCFNPEEAKDENANLIQSQRVAEFN